jgi:predicted Rossmann-fold nucleotide-binding protein
MPIVLVHGPYWRGLLDWFRATLVAEGMIDKDDLDLIKVIDEPAAVVDAIFEYYDKRGFEPSVAEDEVLLNL